MHYWIAYGLLGFVFALMPLAAHAEEESHLRFFDQATQSFIEAPGIATDVHIEVNGTTARTHIVQYFFNHTQDWQEGVYRYPLPDQAAVDRLVMVVDERRILGFVAEKEQAKKIYEQAKTEGKAAGLVEQHRSNIFKTSVANIPPRALVAIEIAYQQEVAVDDDTMSLRTPLAITPRYDHFTAEDFMALCDEDGTPQYMQDVGDRIALFDFADGQNPVRLSVDFSSGLDGLEALSSSHDIEAERGDGIYKIRTSQPILPGKQDFVLSWKTPESEKAMSFMHSEKIEGEYYTHLVVLPPSEVKEPIEAPRRQVTMIIDTSGSMSGPSIKQAKSALHEALSNLTPADYFNVIRFESQTEALYREPRAASTENIKRALRWVSALDASGGTEMMPALKKAFKEREIEGLLRQIVFITDGAIGYEGQMSAYIKDNIGNGRFYAVGIGAAPNEHLMRSFARTGRGTFTFIGDVKETQEKMGALFRKMKAPVLTDLSLDLGGIKAEMAPANLPDLMIGEPISVAIRSQQPLQSVKLKGLLGRKAWHQHVEADSNRNAPGIGKIYARRKIQDLTLSDLQNQKEETKALITALGIEHQLVSSYTSLVAVDEKVIRPKNATLFSKSYDPNLPKGWQLAEYDPRQAAEDYEKAMAEKDETKPEDALKHKINLPQTATGYHLQMLLGLVLSMMALLLQWMKKEEVYA